MRLYLVQHGEAKTASQDPERPLTDSGAEAVERMGRWVAGVGIRVGEIRHSGKRRAEETAELLAGQLKPTGGVRAVAGLGPTDDVQPTASALGSETGAVMLVGHLPFLSRLVGQLVAGDRDATVVRFHNAGIVGLCRENDEWSVDWALPPTLAR